MIGLTVAELARLSAGTVHGADPDAIVYGPVVVDSRRATPGSVFVAVKGERVDGHDFALQAVGAGAVAVLARRVLPAVPTVLVADPVAALGLLARGALALLPGVEVVAITGSSGKTGTKDLVTGLLESLGPTVGPPGSYNTEIGLPLTVLAADASTRYLVLELGARGIGHVRELTQIAPPAIGVVLNVGSAHLAAFGSRAAIANAKAELVEALPAGGLAVLSADDDLVASMAGRTAARVVLFGTSAAAQVRADQVSVVDGRARFTLLAAGGSAPVRLELVGAHHVGNALAAAAVALEAGAGLESVAAALSAARPRSPWRMEVRDTADAVTVINDAYNANPESTRAALRALVDLAGGRRTWAVLGEMRELGATSAAEHAELGRVALELGVDRLVTVGEQARAISVPGADAVAVPDADAAVALLRGELAAGDVVLVKASRAAGLERVAAALLDPGGAR